MRSAVDANIRLTPSDAYNRLDGSFRYFIRQKKTGVLPGGKGTAVISEAVCTYGG